jgi:hypothetical protein
VEKNEEKQIQEQEEKENNAPSAEPPTIVNSIPQAAQHHVTSAVSAIRADSKEKSPEENGRPDSRGGERPSQPRVPCIEGLQEQDKFNHEGFMEPVRKGRKVPNRGSGDGEWVNCKVVSASQIAGGNTNKKSGGVVGGKAAANSDAGWKEVVRKSKKVSVPSNAISRVIGRGGSNINAIRELSGAHIEVEKQSKGQGDRTILIKGSADATRLANTWISSIIASPDKDLQEIVGKQQYKLLSSSVLAKAAAVSVSKAVQVKTMVTTTSRTGKIGEVKKTTVTATISTATKITVSFTAPVVSSKAKTVTSTSFAAIAAGNDSMGGMIQTGPPPSSVSANKLPTLAAAMAAQQQSKAQLLLQQQLASSNAMVGSQQQPIGKPRAASVVSTTVVSQLSQLQQHQQQTNIVKKEDKAPHSAASSAGPTSTNPASVPAADPKDFSPFKTLNFQPQTFGWNAFGDNAANVKGFSTAPGSGVMAASSMAQSADMSKAPGYRPPSSQGQARHGSPNITAENNWSAALNQPGSSNVSAPGQGFRTAVSGANTGGVIGSVVASSSVIVDQTVTQVVGGSGPGGNQLYPAQERCNSAPGTPVSPSQVPSPIAPPCSIATSVHQQQSVSGGGSPSSDTSGWFRPPGVMSSLVSSASGMIPPPSGMIGSNLRSLTPDGELDRRWTMEDDLPPRRQGSGSYGHNSPAKAPGAPIQDPFGRGVLSELMANQLSNMPFHDSNHLMAVVSSTSNGMSMAPGIGMPDLATAFSRSAGPPMMSRFTAPPLTSSTLPTYSQGIHMPDSGLPKAPGLNPNAPDFNQSGMYNPGLRSVGMPPRLGPMMNGPQKMGSAAGFPGYGGHFDGGLNNFQSMLQNQSSILQNQSINAYLSQLGGMAPQVNHNLDHLVPSSFSDLSGKTLSELMDMPESRYPTNMDALSDHYNKFRQPIGAERRAAPSPIGMPPSVGNLNRKVDPYTVWDMPPSYNAADNLHTSATAADSFTRLIPSLSGQTISSLDNLVASGGGVGNFNAAPGTLMVDGAGGPVSGIGMTGHTVSGPGGVAGMMPPSSMGPPAFGMSANLTPSKLQDYADWGAPGGVPVGVQGVGSAPGSANKNLMGGAGGGYIERGDPTPVRRNIVTNQNAMWPKNWAEE